MSTPPVRYFRPGAYLFKEGQSSNSMFLIKKGSVGVRKKKGSAHVEIARIYTNEVIGELSFFDRQPRSASAVALNEVEALEIQFESLDKIYEGVPDYLKTIMACVADRLRKANDTIRRLQKNVVYDGEGGEGEAVEGEGDEKATDDTPNASDIIAASSGSGEGTEGGGEGEPEDK